MYICRLGWLAWYEFYELIIYQSKTILKLLKLVAPTLVCSWGLAATVFHHLIRAPKDVSSAVAKLNSGKSPGMNGLSAENLKYGGERFTCILTDLMQNVWGDKLVSQY